MYALRNGSATGVGRSAGEIIPRLPTVSRRKEKKKEKRERERKRKNYPREGDKLASRLLFREELSVELSEI